MRPRVPRASLRAPFRFWLLLFFLCFCSYRALAHQGSTSYLTLIVENNRVHGRWEIPVRDLDLALGLDVNVDQKVSPEEIATAFEEIESFALPQVKLRLDEVAAMIQITNAAPLVHDFPDGASLALDFVVTNATVSRFLEIEYHFMFDRKPLERAFVQLECEGVTQTGIFTAEETVRRFDLQKRRTVHEFLSFLWHGVHHIWIGYDHILFLISLLLPAVLHFEQNQWRAVSSFREAFINVLKVVTAFTVAHSITLSLAALQIFSLPSRWVESAIAASVLVAALNNIRVLFQKRVWLVAFGFGLIHGFGFASVLTDLGLPKRDLVMALVGFNLGVELGQLAIVLVFLPMAFSVRQTTFYRRWVMKLGSALIALVACLWLVERAFDLKILSS
jgi:hypothetical protein